jgi:hypothetical protein
VSWVPLTPAAQSATEEEDRRVAREKLVKFFEAHPDCGEEVLWQFRGLWGIDSGNLNLLRDAYQEWIQEAERQAEEEQRQAAEEAKRRAEEERRILAEETARDEKKRAISKKRAVAGAAGGKEKARRRDKEGVAEKKAKKFLL